MKGISSRLLMSSEDFAHFASRNLLSATSLLCRHFFRRIAQSKVPHNLNVSSKCHEQFFVEMKALICCCHYWLTVGWSVFAGVAIAIALHTLTGSSVQWNIVGLFLSASNSLCAFQSCICVAAPLTYCLLPSAFCLPCLFHLAFSAVSSLNMLYITLLNYWKISVAT